MPPATRPLAEALAPPSARALPVVGVGAREACGPGDEVAEGHRGVRLAPWVPSPSGRGVSQGRDVPAGRVRYDRGVKIPRLPNGFVELVGDNVVITGGEAVIIPRSSVRSAVCRDGKGSFFSRTPPAVLEIVYVAGLDEVRTKLLVPREAKDEAVATLGAWGLPGST